MLNDRGCPCCKARGLRPFYEALSIPLQSNLLAPTRDEAVDMPRGDLSLAYCPACGFITNTAYDPKSQQLDAKYEASQGFSATFGSFARNLATRWARDYLKPGKTALEIGCLTGEFTTLLHEISGCRAIGLDPVLAAPSAPGAPVTLIPDYYSEKYADLPADLIVCRHTLEHIVDAGEFVRMLRRVIGQRSETVVAFEVPDTLRVLREGAFWDLYYEHSSYFTPGSLARLFRSASFDLIDLRLEYDEQYLILEAKPVAEPTTARFNLEDDLAAVEEAVSGFGPASERQMARWQRVVDESLVEGKRIVLWGSGSKAVGFLSTLQINDDRVPYVVDINPRKQNTFLPGTGQKIVGPDALQEYRPEVVIVMNPIYRDEIRRDLESRGLTPDVLTL
jgi:SAM-dependent methyltransferase